MTIHSLLLSFGYQKMRSAGSWIDGLHCLCWTLRFPDIKGALKKIEQKIIAVLAEVT